MLDSCAPLSAGAADVAAGAGDGDDAAGGKLPAADADVVAGEDEVADADDVAGEDEVAGEQAAMREVTAATRPSRRRDRGLSTATALLSSVPW
jgi:hypothetical protein